MAYNKRLDAIGRARVLLQNPYAYIEDLEGETEAPVRSPLHLTENPWATLAAYNGDDAAAELATPRVDPEPRPTFKEYLSKSDFRSECIRIFSPYVPPHLPRRIPQHQKDFIARNEQRSGKVRHRLVDSLRRYDLSTTPSLAPQFNREHLDDLSEKKLRQIEALVGDDD